MMDVLGKELQKRPSYKETLEHFVANVPKKILNVKQHEKRPIDDEAISRQASEITQQYDESMSAED
jgi:hypothetical protein